MKLLNFWLLNLFFFSSAFSITSPPYLTGQDRFEFNYSLTLPDLKEGQTARIWIPIAESDPFQSVELIEKSDGIKFKETVDQKFHNRAWIIDFDKKSAGKKINFKYRVLRKEKTSYPGPNSQLQLYLEPDLLVPLDNRFKKLATEITQSQKSDREKGRAIYDYVLSLMKYDKTGTGWGRGDAIYACDVKKGNCTDFHALFIAIARSAKIPSRFMIGFTIPPDKSEGTIEGYHCWAEFFADGQWIPIDISEASKHPEAKEYYFGHHPANRFQLTQGRDLVFSTSSQDGPINFLVHPYLEIQGKSYKLSGEYSFKRTP